MRVWLFGALFCGACSGKSEPVDPGKDPTEPPTVTTPVPATGPLWYGEIEPLMREHCVSCHQTGGIGPFGLDTYETAKTWAEASAQAVMTRKMPPWLVTADGSCGEFRDSRWLSEESIDAIVAWAEAGAPQGDPALAVADPLPDLPALDRVDETLQTPEFVPIAVGSVYAPSDEYRCFLLSNPSDADVLLTGFEIEPGNLAIAHHVLVMPVDPQGLGWNGEPNANLIAGMDGADGREGWPCFGTAGGDIREKGVPVVWAPGMGAVEYPQGVGVEVKQQDVYVVQMHYNLADPDNVGASDTTAVHLRTEPAQANGTIRQAWLALPDLFLDSLFSGQPDVIPPGESAYPYTVTLPAWQVLASSGAPEPWFVPFELVSVMPHMHELGSQQLLRVLRADGAEECLADVQDWDFNWQLNYFYEESILIQPDDQIEITCVWDSSALATETLPGWGTSNEMCLFTMMLIPSAQ